MSREHRTAVFIRTGASDEAEYSERWNRLLQSFNNTNIKVDIYFYSDGKKPVGAPENFLEGDIHKFARDMGYVMKMVVTPVFGDIDLPSDDEIEVLLEDLRKWVTS